MSSQETDHYQEHLDRLFLHALQALPADEMDTVERQISSCTDCQKELETLRPIVSTFVGWSTNVLRPPESLRGRLAQRLATELGTEPFKELRDGPRKPQWEQAASGIHVQILARDEENDRVSMADRVAIRAPIVISDTGAANTYGRLLRVNTPKVDRIRRSIASIPPAISHVCLYVGLKGTTSELGLNGTNLWIYPTSDHDKNFQRFVSDPDTDFPGVYISFPSAKDPTFNDRFPGHSTIDVITFAPYDWFTGWEQTHWHKRGIDYEKFKEDIQSRLLRVLYRYVPSVQHRVIHGAHTSSAGAGNYASGRSLCARARRTRRQPARRRERRKLASRSLYLCALSASSRPLTFMYRRGPLESQPDRRAQAAFVFSST